MFKYLLIAGLVYYFLYMRRENKQIEPKDIKNEDVYVDYEEVD
ncbi:MAG TPA: hypothetical protein PK147_09890 [Saprospiraceae bacterium]|nr:hypothetical protein [Saprospiraceae bacterium]HPQ22151.1 hypothetical protein [Saprospiraceae bacterium]HRX29750.1 hypothetical protein [Saprospiraceae bacterium]